MAYLNQVDLGEGLVTSRLLDIKDGDNVLMVEIPEQLHLTESSKAEHGVVEGSNLLDCNLLARWLVQGRAMKRSQISMHSRKYEETFKSSTGTPELTRQRHKHLPQQHLECHIAH